MKMRGIVITVFVVLLSFTALVAADNDVQYTPTTVKNGGTITGKVLFDGAAPKPKEIKVSKDTRVCGKSKLDESLVVDPQTKGIRYAVVYLKDLASGKAWDVEPNALAMDQKGCHFSPHVLVVPAGQPFFVLNSDGILHNIHTRSELNKEINKAQPKFMKKMKLTFEKPEFVKVSCDVHNWMHGWIVAASHPYYAATDASGNFELTDVPPGSYELVVWHETLGVQTQQVTVKAGEATTANFTLKP